MDWLKLLIHKGQTWNHLSNSERILFLQAFCLIPLVALSLHCFGLRKTQNLMLRLTPSSSPPTQQLSFVDFLHKYLCRLFCIDFGTYYLLLITYYLTSARNQVVMTSRMVRLATRYQPLFNNCLRQSLVLWWLLHRQGINSDLRIGVQRHQNHFQAHAWLEYNGFPLNEQQDVQQRFATFNQPIDVVDG